MAGAFDRDTAHFRIGPLTTYADPAELERKFRRAGSGERVTYAVGPGLSATAPTRLLAMRWQELGLCHLARERCDAGWRYFVEKRPGATTRANEVSAGRSIAGRPEERLLMVLVDLAEPGAALPSLDLLAERAGLPTRYAADYRMRLLVEAGFIRIRREGLDRFVEILNREASL